MHSMSAIEQEQNDDDSSDISGFSDEEEEEAFSKYKLARLQQVENSM